MKLFTFTHPTMTEDVVVKRIKGKKGQPDQEGYELYVSYAVVGRDEEHARTWAARKIECRPDIDPGGFLMHDWKLIREQQLPSTWDNYWTGV
ncbi:hypothetical protein [Achromobacter phage Motura]|uniref:Uncharacterized protein n=1 Tax=Achromobacter phage Motura TaxID=2591403 RepID=A0A514CST2_9CAUD|nr:hypothetical protein H1O15_gp256 [Achromobacter phage Motura]QDH83532.1 hypothetical protein [Achromobacter phage Motura]